MCVYPELNKRRMLLVVVHSWPCVHVLHGDALFTCAAERQRHLLWNMPLGSLAHAPPLLRS